MSDTATLSTEDVQARAVDTGAWDGTDAMSACANAEDPAACYRAICAGRKDGDPSTQAAWALPHHDSPDAPPNAAAVRNALARLPQTEGLENEEAARRHLLDHLNEDVRPAENRAEVEPEQVITFDAMEADVQVRSMAKREIDVRIVPWERVINTVVGPEMFVRGAFEGTDPAKVLLMGLEHEAHIGLGQDGTPKLARRPIGRGTSLQERDDGAYMTFRVAKTAAGDEYLALADDRVVDGVSVELGGNARIATDLRNGRRLNVVQFADLQAVAPTYRPAYQEARLLAVRSNEEDAPVATEEKAPAAGATAVHNTVVVEEEPKPAEPQFRSADAAIGAIDSALSQFADKFSERIEKLEERARSQFVVPGAEPSKPDVNAGHWLQYALNALAGERISTSDAQYRTLADLVTSDNLGVVPDAFSRELIGVIDPSRPFMSSTRRLPTPSSGMTLHVPKLETRPTVGIQSEEKAELTSTPTSITTADFSAVTKGGAGDISLQLLRRSDPSFLDLYLRLLGEAYAHDSEKEALEALLDSDVDDGNTLDPTDAQLGAAFATSFSVMRRGPDTMWLSTAAVAAFIDAVNPTTGTPIYSSITADFSVPGGITGTVKGLRPVHVPELGALGADVIVGPSNGFAWAEDGTYTLQVDVPARAGRDVALVGILWFAPWYPEAFTVYTLGS